MIALDTANQFGQQSSGQPDGMNAFCFYNFIILILSLALDMAAILPQCCKEWHQKHTQDKERIIKKRGEISSAVCWNKCIVHRPFEFNIVEAHTYVGVPISQG